MRSVEENKAACKAYYRRNREVLLQKKREYHAANRSQRTAYMRTYKLRKRMTDIDWVKRRMFANVRANARRKGIPFTVSFSDIFWPEKCPVFGQSFNFSGGKQGYFDWNPSFDRIDPKQGYVPGNIQIISARANRLKCNATLEELEQLVAYMRVFA